MTTNGNGYAYHDFDPGFVANRLGKAKRSGKGWVCLCPAHDDHHTSLSIGVGPDGKPLVRCFAGCSQQQVIGVLRSRDLWPKLEKDWEPMVPPPADALKATKWELTADTLFSYHTADGQFAFYVKRFEAKGDKPKTFLPLVYGTLDSKTGWHLKHPAAPKLLYNLHELTTRPDAPVLLCEGEKPAEAARPKFPEYVVTSWMGGSSAVAQADWRPLAGRHVVLWPDADEAGAKAAADVVKHVTVAAIVNTAGLVKPGGGGFDAADLNVEDPTAWLRERLIERPKAKPFEYLLADLQHLVFPPMKWAVPEYFPEGLTVFAGRPKIGKSWMILNVALAKARGTEALGQFVDKGDVLYIALEDGPRRMQTRVNKILGPGKAWPDNLTVLHKLDPLDAGGLDTIERWIMSHPAASLVAIDTFGKVRGSKRQNEEQYTYDYRVVGSVQELATAHNVAIILVHHVRKSDAEDVLDTVSGTTGIAGAADTVVVLGRTDKGIRMAVRGRDVEEQDKLVEMDPDTGIWSVEGDWGVDDGPQGLGARIVTLLVNLGVPLTPKEIAERLDAEPSSTRVALLRMARNVPPLVKKSEKQPGAYEAETVKR